eukprot:GABV01006028.1.p1 GENE.GABV01006028.1~~GABV01006028.1.p1  ORF type:complete len:119 (+),score=14.17 GABV01006028.1:36-392(+)
MFSRLDAIEKKNRHLEYQFSIVQQHYQQQPLFDVQHPRLSSLTVPELDRLDEQLKRLSVEISAERTNRRRCVACKQTRVQRVVFVPCGCQRFCVECARGASVCRLRNKPIERAIPITN